MIKLKIERYRDFTEEENKAREEWQRKNNNFGGLNRYNELTPFGIEKYFEGMMDVEITNEQFEAIRKSVLENF
jgi:hypothetical protein